MVHDGHCGGSNHGGRRIHHKVPLSDAPQIAFGCHGPLGSHPSLHSRYWSLQNPTVLLPITITQSLVILAPVVNAAMNYVLASRIIAHAGSHFGFISANRIVIFFVSSDILTFLIQCGGAALFLSGSTSSSDLGRNILLGGLALQVPSFGLFMASMFVFDYRTRKQLSRPLRKQWEPLLWALYISSLCIMIRSVFRVVEFSQGKNGYISAHEIYFYIFDTILMYIATVALIIVHPGRYLGVIGQTKRDAIIASEEGTDSALSNPVTMVDLGKATDDHVPKKVAEGSQRQNTLTRRDHENNMISVLKFLVYIGGALGFCFLILSLASGLYLLAEWVEEYTVQAKKVIRWTSYIVIATHLLLFLDNLPWWRLIYSFGCQLWYLQLLPSFPIIELTNPVFLGVCGMVVINHFIWFWYFTQKYHPFSQIATFFGLCVWLVPFLYFISLSANDYTLPAFDQSSASRYGENGSQTSRKRSLVKTIVNFFLRRDDSGGLPPTSGHQSLRDSKAL
ncbi:hypothetical protein SmJEL517_g05376 [Synchytrium microbalum]|uniref:Transmembrane protein n=1 Tax=Synchytrium microbalum TaxID=1806994 RepID=A0A507BZT4_9FUNG|nr:uncharacterized protein SmJEL517_g05376 [Synchytrium microbalum]TPX31256.1 hypothetical protein SmJEL517_g05376 [Synchytrium microbalum]